MRPTHIPSASYHAVFWVPAGAARSFQLGGWFYEDDKGGVYGPHPTEDAAASAWDLNVRQRRKTNTIN
jgi:hypothetical protein